MENPEQLSPEQTAQSAPPVLAYAATETRQWSFSFLAGSLLLAIAFAATFWLVEIVTSNVMLFHVQIEGPADPGTYEEYKMEKRQFNDLLTEFVWSLPATVIVYAALMAFGPRAGLRLSAKVFGAVIVGAIAYSWVRWGLDLTPLKPSEGADFWIAMVLAALAGVGASFVRSKLPIVAKCV